VSLPSIGLGGDGDEVDAITAAFSRFGVEVPVEDAPDWNTVGDVWSSLCRILPQAPNQPDAWRRFLAALCEETGADPDKVGLNTRLLA
jgi:hypothetical protein